MAFLRLSLIPPITPLLMATHLHPTWVLGRASRWLQANYTFFTYSAQVIGPHTACSCAPVIIPAGFTVVQWFLSTADHLHPSTVGTNTCRIEEWQTGRQSTDFGTQFLLVCTVPMPLHLAEEREILKHSLVLFCLWAIYNWLCKVNQNNLYALFYYNQIIILTHI